MMYGLLDKVPCTSLPAQGEQEWENSTLGMSKYLSLADHLDLLRDKVPCTSLPAQGEQEWENSTLGMSKYLSLADHLDLLRGPSVLELSSDNNLVDGPTDRPTYRPTDRPTDMSKAIYPLFFEGGHNKSSCYQPVLRREEDNDNERGMV
ncbi:hypothetical protein DPMN_012708 [Dreissena polymorpha]|uniref:Uncharacterized protein n=1 Tax=Dreissena polymorpha TaxID=45954 RepID=A0A9D4N7H4_DREPO|nr:hypothetical protein DPMN_012708 [Dreissena polymorpha]